MINVKASQRKLAFSEFGNDVTNAGPVGVLLSEKHRYNIN